ncbi:unnamed protein product [Choristocarpus tenellus]
MVIENGNDGIFALGEDHNNSIASDVTHCRTPAKAQVSRAIRENTLNRLEGGMRAQESGTSVAILKECKGKRNVQLALPTFQLGNVKFSDIANTSVRLTWDIPGDTRHTIYGYRISTAEKNKGFEVTYDNTDTSERTCTVVNLHPGGTYRFHVACLSAENMIIPDASVVSPTVSLPEANYEKAWFFEGAEEDIKWFVYEGSGPHMAVTKSGAALDDIRWSISEERCFTGLRSMCLMIPCGLVGGVCVETTVTEGWVYICRARVFHEEPPLGETRLALWDIRDTMVVSPPAEKQGEWELLECEIMPFCSDNLRIALKVGGEYHGNIFVDAVELHHGGPTPAEIAGASLAGVLAEVTLAIQKVELHVLSAAKLKASDTMGTSDPYVKVRSDI